VAAKGPALWRALRPNHWIKNVFVFAALVFAHKLGDPEAIARSAAAFVVFCLLSSAVYLLNDILDREADRAHPVKRERPIASGRVSVATAGTLSVALAVVGLAGAMALGTGFAAVASAYVFMNIAYSLRLKRIVILDVMLVAAGFLLRAWGGAAVLRVEMSDWLILCTGLIALFLGFVKRRQEIAGQAPTETTRPILREYSLPFLDQMIAIVTSSTLLAYALYVFSPEVAEKLGTRYMGLTLPFVLFGIFRYLYLVHQRGKGESPTDVVVRDGPLVATFLLWGAACLVALYLLR
jgi:4-hydroxybenzoate polyprenyltransferase